jgi:hypothetical protein
VTFPISTAGDVVLAVNVAPPCNEGAAEMNVNAAVHPVELDVAVFRIPCGTRVDGAANEQRSCRIPIYDLRFQQRWLRREDDTAVQLPLQSDEDMNDDRLLEDRRLLPQDDLLPRVLAMEPLPAHCHLVAVQPHHHELRRMQ